MGIVSQGAECLSGPCRGPRQARRRAKGLQAPERRRDREKRDGCPTCERSPPPSTRMSPLRVLSPPCWSLLRQRGQTPKEHAESSRGTSPGAPRGAAGRSKRGSGSRMSGLTPQGGHWVRSRPVLSCLHCTTLGRWRGAGVGGWPKRSRQRPSVRAVCRLARKPEGRRPAAAGEPRQEETADTGVGVERHGLSPMARTTVPGGKAAPPIPPLKAPVVRDGHTLGRAADRIPEVLRACTGWLGVDAPLGGIELGTKRCDVRRPASAGRLLRAGQGVGGPEPGQRLTELPAQTGPHGAHGTQAARSSLDPAHPRRRARQPP
jgi:hypothetical protein